MSHYTGGHEYSDTSYGTTSDAESVSTGISSLARTVLTSPIEEPLASPTSFKKRRSSKITSEKQLSHSVSTPQLPQGAMSDSDVDKKRNKLGYQRISIACAHCRRRKIRCIPAEGDPQSRCANCIRLKKECVFYPVEQQTAIESRAESSTQSNANPSSSSAVSMSPQDRGSETGFDTARDPSRFATLPSNAPLIYNSVPFEPVSSTSSQGAFSQSGYDTPEDHELRGWATTTTMNPPGRASQTPTLGSPPFSRYGQPAQANDFAPFPNNDATRLPRVGTWQNASSAPQGFDPAWHQSQHVRPVSYGQVDGMQTHPSAYTAPFQLPNPQLNQSLRYPPSSLAISTHHGSTPVMGPHSAPVGGPMHSFGQQLPFAYPPDNTLYHSQSYPAGWYSEHATFAPVTEEPDNYPQQSRPG